MLTQSRAYALAVEATQDATVIDTSRALDFLLDIWNELPAARAETEAAISTLGGRSLIEASELRELLDTIDPGG